jgi:NAD(P)-dependent dehydrogenase (short-subunit alcohol dehydrogenase family)
MERETCVITGAAAGLGLETAKQLVAAGMTVIGIDRETARCRGAEEAIRVAAPRADVGFVPADLSSLTSVRRAARDVRRLLRGGRLDCLIHAAETMTASYAGTADGHELQFALNYLAPFQLTAELFPALIRPAESCVIAVSSAGHRRMTIDWEDPMLRQRYDGVRAYRQSKLALVLFVLELNRRVAFRFPVRGFGVEAGLAETSCPQGEAGMRAAMSASRTPPPLSPADAAAALTRLALCPPASIADSYWRLGRPVRPSPFARDAAAAGRLWRLSETLCGVRFL